MAARVAAIEKWTAVADICRCLHNFNGVLQICAAFTNAAVYRLKKTWDKVPRTVSTRIDGANGAAWGCCFLFRRIHSSSSNSKMVHRNHQTFKIHAFPTIPTNGSSIHLPRVCVCLLPFVRSSKRYKDVDYMYERFRKTNQHNNILYTARPVPSTLPTDGWWRPESGTGKRERTCSGRTICSHIFCPCNFSSIYHHFSQLHRCEKLSVWFGKSSRTFQHSHPHTYTRTHSAKVLEGRRILLCNKQRCRPPSGRTHGTRISSRQNGCLPFSLAAHVLRHGHAGDAGAQGKACVHVYVYM